jgi:NitT/TauT family transport system substrate-binding protein
LRTQPISPDTISVSGSLQQPKGPDYGSTCQVNVGRQVQVLRKIGIASASRRAVQTRLLIRIFVLLALVSTPVESETRSFFPLKIQLDWTYDAQFSGILMAKTKGYYREAGLDVTVTPVDASMNTSGIVEGSDNGIGFAEADILLVDRAKGHHIKAFATTFQTTPFALITLKQSGLTSVASLRGKKIGLHSDGQKAIDVILQHNGMTRRDVQIVDVPDKLDPLISGQVDAMQGYVTDEVIQLELAHHPVNIIPFGDNGYISYAEVMFASDACLQEHPDQLAQFLRATNRGWEFTIKNQEAAAKLLVDTFHAEGGVHAQLLELEKIQPLLTYETKDNRFGLMNPQTWEKSLAMFRDNQFLAGPVELSDVVDYSVLKRVYPDKN